MNKKDRRRQQLQNSHKADLNNRPSFDMIVKHDGSIARTPISRRMLAIIMALVFILTVVPTTVFLSLRGRAEGETESDLTGVRLTVQLGDEDYGEAYIEPGAVSETIKNVSVDGLPEGAEFIKAVLRESDTETETEVKYIGGQNGLTYYSLSEKADIGTKLEESYQEIVLVYGIKRWITVNQTGEGEYKLDAHKEGNDYYVWNGEDLKIQGIVPDKSKDYTISEVSYVSGSSNGTLAIENSSVTIPASSIRDDITVTLPFKKTNSYTITDVSLSKNLGNGGLAETLGVSRFTDFSSRPSYFRTRYLPEAVSAGGSKTFYLYSSSNTGGSNYQLNRLSINGTELEVSNVDNEDVYVELDGVKVTVHLQGVNQGLYWLDNKPNATFFHDRDANWTQSGNVWTADGWNKKRTIYAITVEDVHTNLDIEYNFKQKSNREIIIKGLRGITETAHARERLGNGTWGTLGLPAYEYYFEQAASNVYNAYYYETALIPSANLYLYRVERGYNPYTVTSDVYYIEGTEVVHQENAVLSGGAKVGLPEEAIRDATAGLETNNRPGSERFNASFRKWGGHGEQQRTIPLENDDNIYDGADFLPIGNPYMLSYIGNNNNPKWYALALVQNSAKNQQLYLNASPYQFKLELDLDGGSLADDRFDSVDGMLLEKESHSIEDPITFLPDKEPVRNDYIFEGWQLQKWNKSANEGNGAYVDVDNAVYQRMDEINIDNDTILGLVKGTSDDQRIRLQAVWAPVTEATKTTVTTDIFKEVPAGTENSFERGGKHYIEIYSDRDTQVPGSIVLLNQHAPSPSEYYVQRKGTYTEDGIDRQYTKLSSTSVKQTDANVIPEENQLRIYYDYKTVDLGVRKLTRGKVKSKTFDITVKLTSDGTSPIFLQEAYTMLSHESDGTVSIDGNSLVYTKTFSKNEKVTLSKIPYKWNYELEEADPVIDNDYTPEYSPNQSGQLTRNTDAVVLNKGEQPSVETEKDLVSTSNNQYQITLGGYATGESYVEEFKQTDPIDFAIVVDQSGSMASGDVGKMYVPTARKGWTVNSATSEQYFYLADNGKYYPVYSKTGTLYSLASSRHNLNGTLLNGTTFWSLDWHPRTNGGNYYVYDEDDDEMYYLYFLESGFESIGSYHVKFFYVRDTRINHSNADSYKETAEAYYNAGSDRVRAVTVNGKEEESYARWAVTGGLGPVNSNSKYLDVPVYTQGTGANSLYYKDDDDVEHKIGKTAKTASSSVYTGRLYTEKDITRMAALQDSINQFVEAVADNAAASEVDHRVALIGFAGDEKPANNASGTGALNDQQEYINTGLFTSGQFKNYKSLLAQHNNASTINTSNYYHIKVNNKYVPVIYENAQWKTPSGSITGITPAYYRNGKWYCQGTHITGGSDEFDLDNNFVDGSDRTNWGYTVASNVYRFYVPQLESLSTADYKNSLIDANVSNSDVGKVNPALATEINMLRAEGGTYISYGMEMANQVFANNPDEDGEERKRVIIVFSDGMPGDGSTFSTTEANKSYGYASTAETDYGADIYTVFLYGTSTNPSHIAPAEEFLANLATDSDHAMTSDSANGLMDIFENISEDMEMNVTSVTLGPDNSYMRDVVTKDFDLPTDENGNVDLTKFHAKLVTGTMASEDAEKPTWSTEEDLELTADNLVITYNSDGTKTIDVKKYDYAGNYIAYNHPGKKLVLTIDGLTIPEGKTGTLYSNTVESGIYKMDEEDTMVVEFPMPDPVTIEPLKAKVTLNYEGVNAITTQKFPVTFKLTKSDGETGYEGEFGGHTFSSDGEFKTTMGTGETKEFDNIPPGAILTMTVTNPDDATLYYTYSADDLDKDTSLELKTGTDLIPKQYDQEGQEIEPSAEAVAEALKKHQASVNITNADCDGASADDTREVRVNIVDNRLSAAVTNETQGTGDGDYSDPKREFPIRLTIKDSSNQLFNGTLMDTSGREVDVENGIAVFNLAHEKSRGIYVPAGFTIVVEDNEDASPYQTTFFKKTDGGDVTTTETSATADMSTQNADILVVHSIEAPVVTGVDQGVSSSNILVFVLGGVAVLSSGAGAYYVYNRKRKYE